MQKISIQSNKKSDIIIGEKMANISQYFPTDKVIIITDINLDKHYAETFPNFPKIVISTGESIKTLKTVEEITSQLIDLELDRHSFILGIGGGIVCDITGFVASIYMRGLDFGFISTSLLSQVDASVGGKNGVNFNSYKNLIGNFNQPKFVLCELDMLKTLPKKEIRNGMGEIIKHALIADSEMFDFISSNYQNILNLDLNIIEKLISDNVKIKASVVEKDEQEQGERKKLNFGHTLAHAIEKHSDLSHGEAVAVGIIFASKISLAKKYITEKELNSIVELLKKLNLPTELDVDKAKIADAMLKDKKRNNKEISFILLDGIGNAKIENITINQIEKYLYDLC